MCSRRDKTTFAIVMAFVACAGSAAPRCDWAGQADGRSIWLSTEGIETATELPVLWGGSSPVPSALIRSADGRVTLTKSYSHPDHPDWAWTRTLSFVPSAGDSMECVFFETRANRPGKDVTATGTVSRLPPLPARPDLAAVRYGEPIDILKDGLDGFDVLDNGRASQWRFADGVLENGGSGANIRTKRGDFSDFRISYDVRVDKDCNSGVYLRGIYELQVSDSFGKPVDSHNMAALYGRIVPSVSAEKPAGEWQHVEAILCRRHLTVTLNGVRIIDNEPIRGVTGGALSTDESLPGPIGLQGDHKGGAYRNMVLTPIITGPRPVAKDDPPLMMVRLRAPHTADDAQWARTFKALSGNRGACDDVWFSTGIGIPKPGWHEEHARRLARYAADLRRIGISASLQVQATLGHSDTTTALEPVDGKAWGGFVGRGGTEAKYCSCPRQPAFLAYEREMGRIYGAAFHPRAIWIDDDLRVAGHAPASPWERVSDGWVGCWCPTCIAAFNAETGGSWTRESLDRACADDPALFERWEAFSYRSIAGVARAIAEGVRDVSPETFFGLQHGCGSGAKELPVYEALHEVTGHPVGTRPGGGAYYDFNPADQGVKALTACAKLRELGHADWIVECCPEIETYPRAFASRTAQGLLNEAIVNLAWGMNCLSLLIMDTRYETDEWYSRNILGPLAAERGLLEGYRRVNAGTVPCGLALPTGDRVTNAKLHAFALCGIPVVPGVGIRLANVPEEETRIELGWMSSKAIMDLRRRMDRLAGGRLPVVAEEPSVGLIIARTTADGTLKSVMIENARIDTQAPLPLRLRGVPAGVAKAIWRAFRRKAVDVSVAREGADARVTVPELAPWSCGWLELKVQ